jgi:hypothetical protein
LNRPIPDRHAVDVPGLEAEVGIEASIEAIILVGIRDVDDLTVLRHCARDSGTDFQFYFRIDFLGDEGPQMLTVRGHDEHGPALDADFVSNDLENDLGQFGKI